MNNFLIHFKELDSFAIVVDALKYTLLSILLYFKGILIFTYDIRGRQIRSNTQVFLTYEDTVRHLIWKSSFLKKVPGKMNTIYFAQTNLCMHGSIQKGQDIDEHLSEISHWGQMY